MKRGFTTQNVYISKDGKAYHWSWNNEDEMYYRDDVDDVFCCDIPMNGRKCISLREDRYFRKLVKMDK